MTYHLLAPEERYMLAALRRQGLNQAELARSLGHHRSTVCRELRRNSTRSDGRYRAFTAQERADRGMTVSLPRPLEKSTGGRPA